MTPNNYNAGKPFIIESGRPGPSVVIMGGVHGDETCGVEALNAFINGEITLRPLKGTITLLYANPLAIERNVRFVDDNLNRLFLPSAPRNPKGYEAQRIEELRAVLDQTDILLDLHASYTPNSAPFVICERNASDLIQSLPVDIICFGFDAVQPGGTDYYMNAKGNIGICVECGYLGNPMGTRTAIDSCMALLSTLGMIDAPSPQPVAHRIYQAIKQYYTKTDVFRLTQPWSDFAQVPANTVIAYDGTEEVIAPHDCALLFARDRDKAGEEALLFLEKI